MLGKPSARNQEFLMGPAYSAVRGVMMDTEDGCERTDAMIHRELLQEEARRDSRPSAEADETE